MGPQASLQARAEAPADTASLPTKRRFIGPKHFRYPEARRSHPLRFCIKRTQQKREPSSDREAGLKSDLHAQIGRPLRTATRRTRAPPNAPGSDLRRTLGLATGPPVTGGLTRNHAARLTRPARRRRTMQRNTDGKGKKKLQRRTRNTRTSPKEAMDQRERKLEERPRLQTLQTREIRSVTRRKRGATSAATPSRVT